MSIRCSLSSRGLLPAVLLAFAVCSTAHAQSATAPMPFYRKTAGWLVSDTAAKKIFLCRDLNGNGSFADPGEVTVFFDGTNASGVAANCTDSVFTMYQASDGTVYYGNGASNTVYAIRDNNLSGTAQDAGEGRIFFDQTNFSGVFLPTPNGLTGDATFLYVCNAGTSPAPQDGIYRLRDVNADGNANASGESSIFLDMNTVIASNISSPFDICNLNGALIYADNRDTATPDRLYRVQDADASGTISASELTVFHTVAAFGAPSGAFVQTCVTDGTSIYTHDRTASVNPQRVARLTDANSSGSIDAHSSASRSSK